MITTLDQLARLLHTHHIAAENLDKLKIDMTSEHAFALALDPANELDVWHFFRTRIQQTEHYPILVEDWGNDRAFFSPYWYEHERSVGLIPDSTPDTILAAVPQAKLDIYLRQQEFSYREGLAEAIDWEREQTKMRFGDCPTNDHIATLVEQQIIQTRVDLERWLFDWERQTFGDAYALVAQDTSYLDWFDAKTFPSTLVLLPIREGWKTLAYLHWYGALRCGTPVAIQFLKKWYRDYRAEVVCHYGTMLQFLIGQAPATPEQAFELAWEQVALAECTTPLPGISMRDHARALLSLKRWFIHERP